MNPSELINNPAKEAAFTKTRQYCVANRIPMSSLSDEDYKKLEILN